MIPKCLILGGDGLDPDVTRNLERLFLGFGYKVSKKVGQVPQDFLGLLVIARSNLLKQSSLLNSRATSVIIYDYVGDNLNNFSYLKNINSDIQNVIFASTSLNRIQDLKFIFDELETSIVFETCLMPVYPKLWIMSSKKNRFNRPIHIGNFKHVTETQGVGINFAFHDFLHRERVLVAGNRWENTLPASQLLGAVKLRAVSILYSCHTYALGIMYPTQRDCTYSGRFWQAPLNGCLVFSEPSIYSSVIPGVLAVDYSQTLEKMVSHGMSDPAQLRLQSRKFWDLERNSHITFLKQLIPTYGFFGKLYVAFFYLYDRATRIKSFIPNWRLLRTVKKYHEASSPG